MRAVVHEQVPLEEVARAHELMESGSHSGKILLTTVGRVGAMSTPQDQQPEADHIMVIGPDGQPVAVPADAVADDEEGGDSAERLTDLVEQPAKVMRIGRMVQQLLEEVKSAPLDEPGRKRLATVLHTSITGAQGRPRPRARRRARPADPALRRDPADRVRAADRAGPAGRLARGALPRHPDRDLRPADGRPLPAGADAPRPPARRDAGHARPPRQDDDGTEPGSQGGMYL